MNTTLMGLARTAARVALWVAMTAVILWGGFSGDLITSGWGIAGAVAVSTALSFIVLFRRNWVEAAGVVVRWMIALFIFAVPVVSVGFLLVGVPPLWGAYFLLAIAVAACLWFLARTHQLRPRPGERRPLMPLVKLAVASFLVTMAAGQVRSWRVDALAKRLKAEGIPVSVADFARDVPKSRNAGPAMEAWTERFTHTAPGEKLESVMDVSKAIEKVDGGAIFHEGDGERDELVAWNAASGPVYDGLAMSYSRLFREVDKGITPILARYDTRVAYDYVAENEKVSPSLPRYAHYVNVNRIYRVMAERKAMRGDVAGAWSVVGKQVRLANLIGQDPYLISKMIALADAGIAVSTASAILKNKRSSVLPASVAKDLAGLTGQKWVQDGFAGEIAYLLHGRKWLRKVSLWGPLPEYWMSWVEYILCWMVDLSGINDAKVSAVIKRAYLPYMRTETWVGCPLQKGDEYVVYPYWIDRIVPWVSAPRFVQLVQKQFEMRTKAQFVLIASALHAYRNRAGKYPAKLSALAPRDIDPKMLVDVFTEKEFGYKVTKAGFEISSPGPWGKGYDSKDVMMKFREPLQARKLSRKKR